MYKIIHEDGNEYGPVTEDKIRLWIIEGRVNGQTKMRAEGTTDWKPLEEFPEFADALSNGVQRSIEAGAQDVSGATNEERETALAMVKGPAIALIVVAGLGIVYYLVNGFVGLVAGGSLLQRELPPDVPVRFRAFLQGFRSPLAAMISLAVAAFDGFVLFGAIQMIQLRNHTVAFIAAIAAMLPCQCCCLLGLPFGIWALIVLNKPEVKKCYRN